MEKIRDGLSIFFLFKKIKKYIDLFPRLIYNSGNKNRKEKTMDIFLKIRVTKEFRDKIKRLCEVKNKNFSQLVREFLEKEFKKNKIK